MPDSRPVTVSSDRPTGSAVVCPAGVSANVPGLLLAVKLNWKTEPTLPVADAALDMTGLADDTLMIKICEPVPL